jgi:hypothetical protein
VDEAADPLALQAAGRTQLYLAPAPVSRAAAHPATSVRRPIDHCDGFGLAIELATMLSFVSFEERRSDTAPRVAERPGRLAVATAVAQGEGSGAVHARGEPIYQRDTADAVTLFV